MICTIPKQTLQLQSSEIFSTQMLIRCWIMFFAANQIRWLCLEGIHLLTHVCNRNRISERERRRNQNSISISKGSLTYWSHFRPFEIGTRGLCQSRNLQSLDPGLRAYCDHKSDSKDVLIIAPIEKTRPGNNYIDHVMWGYNLYCITYLL